MKPIFITEEIWKNLEKFQGYQVSNLGNVRSIDRYRKGKNNTLAKIKGRSLTIRKNKTTCGFKWVINNTKKLEEIL